jgi:hypothetical protein
MHVVILLLAASAIFAESQCIGECRPPTFYALAHPNVTVAAATTTFAGVAGAGFNTVEASRTCVSNADTTKARIIVFTTSAQPTTGAMTFTLRQNGVDTAVTVTVPAGGAAGLYDTGTRDLSVATGDRISLKVVNAAPAAASANIQSVTWTLW